MQMSRHIWKGEAGRPQVQSQLDSKKQMHACMCVCIKEHIDISTLKLAQKFLLNQ